MMKILPIDLKSLTIPIIYLLLGLIGSNLSSVICGTQKNSLQEDNLQTEAVSHNKQKKKALNKLIKWLKKSPKKVIATAIFLVGVMIIFWVKIIKKSKETKNVTPYLPHIDTTERDLSSHSLPLNPVGEKRQKVLAMFKEAIHYDALLYTEKLLQAYDNNNMSVKLKDYVTTNIDRLRRSERFWQHVKIIENKLAQATESELNKQEVTDIVKEYLRLCKEGFNRGWNGFIESCHHNPFPMATTIIQSYKGLCSSELDNVHYRTKLKAAGIIEKNLVLQQKYQDKADYLEEELWHRIHDISEEVYGLVQKHIQNIYKEITKLVAKELTISENLIDQKELVVAVKMHIMQWNVNEIIAEIQKMAEEKEFINRLLVPIVDDKGGFPIDCFFGNPRVLNYVNEACKVFTYIQLCTEINFFLDPVTKKFKPPLHKNIFYNPNLYDQAPVCPTEDDLGEYILKYYKIIYFYYIGRNGLKGYPCKIRATFKHPKTGKLMVEIFPNNWGLKKVITFNPNITRRKRTRKKTKK